MNLRTVRDISPFLGVSVRVKLKQIIAELIQTERQVKVAAINNSLAFCASLSTLLVVSYKQQHPAARMPYSPQHIQFAASKNTDVSILEASVL